jgi:hypothetical protein
MFQVFQNNYLKIYPLYYQCIILILIMEKKLLHIILMKLEQLVMLNLIITFIH